MTFSNSCYIVASRPSLQNSSLVQWFKQAYLVMKSTDLQIVIFQGLEYRLLINKFLENLTRNPSILHGVLTF